MGETAPDQAVAAETDVVPTLNGANAAVKSTTDRNLQDADAIKCAAHPAKLDARKSCTWEEIPKKVSFLPLAESRIQKPLQTPLKA